MKTNRNDFTHRIGAILMLLTIVTFCIVGTSFASLSATYRWTSNETGAGDFDFCDKEFSLNLFGSDKIMLGDFGGCNLTGPAINDGVEVRSWGFSETNTDKIPVVFYILKDDMTVNCAYSSYEFYNYHTQYLKLIDKTGKSIFVETNQISSNPTDFIAGLFIGAKIQWGWPETLYDKVDDEYVETISDISAYQEHNSMLCKSKYAFDDVVLEILNNDKNGSNKFGVIAYATSGNENDFIGVSQISNGTDRFELENGTVKLGDNVIPIMHSGYFVNPIELGIAPEDYLCIFIPSTTVDALTKYLNENNIPITTCEICGTYNKGTWIIEAGGDRTLIKLYPTKLNNKAKLSVTIAATIESV